MIRNRDKEMLRLPNENHLGFSVKNSYFPASKETLPTKQITKIKWFKKYLQLCLQKKLNYVAIKL